MNTQYKVVMISSQSCVPCKMLKPLLEIACENRDLELEYLTIEDNPDLKKFVKDNNVVTVSSVPTLLFCNLDNTVVDMKLGFLPQDRLHVWLDSFLS